MCGCAFAQSAPNNRSTQAFASCVKSITPPERAAIYFVADAVRRSGIDPMHPVRTSARLICGTMIIAMLGIVPALADRGAPPLGSYNADINESSISGISSGAFMGV